MVLNITREPHRWLIFCLLLTGCTHLQQAGDDNRLSERKVVPVTSEPPEVIDYTEPAKATAPQKHAPDTPQKVLTQPDVIDSSRSGKTAAPKKSDVLDAILQQARKAIDNQQWLRAQHHLEHALRIAPQHAQTFYLYAQVYQGLGVPDQATQMLKRALFLSKPDSDLHDMVKRELDALAE